jgi:hypothetical protein
MKYLVGIHDEDRKFLLWVTYSSDTKMAAMCYFEKWQITSQAILHHIREDCNVYRYKYYLFSILLFSLIELQLEDPGVDGRMK